MQEVRIKAVLANDLMSADSLYRELLFNNLTPVINIDINKIRHGSNLGIKEFRYSGIEGILSSV